MKHPFWIANSSLFFLFLLVFGFIYMSRLPLPERENIQPRIYTRPPKEVGLEINISKIYENDLFGTYKKELPPPEEPEYVVPFPEPPEPQRVSVPELPAPQFLDPLDITLKGIIVISSNGMKNRAIITDNKTARETIYRVGDTIDDAQLIRILKNKIILLRTNGQQEVLYLREADAKSDPTFAMLENWDAVIQTISKNYYAVDRKEFTNRVTNLGQFIDILGLTTAYKQGKSIGCKIGQLAEKSLGTYLGLQTNDIILAINEIPATNTEDRLRIYNDIIALQENETIKVKLLRNQQESELIFALQDLTKEAPLDEQLTPATQYFHQERARKEKEKVLKEKHKFAPTLDEIRKREKQNMMKKDKIPRSNASTVTEK